MKQYSHNYRILDRFAVRTPLLPVEELLKIYKASDFEKALRHLIAEKHIAEAIYLSSPEFYEHVIKFDWKTSDASKKTKVTSSLLKYITRLCTRATPFGLFGGIAIGDFGDRTDLKLGSWKEHNRKTRFDFEFMASLAIKLQNNTKVRKNIRYYPNTTLYKVGNDIRYVEVFFEKVKKKYVLQRVPLNNAIIKILQFSTIGSTFKEIVNFIRDEGHQKNKAEHFVEVLIKNQVLISDLEPYSTGPAFDEYISNKLSSFVGLKELDFLKYGRVSTEELDCTIGNDLNKYKSLEIEAIKINPELNRSRLFQVDLFPHFEEKILDRKMKISLSRAINVLSKVSRENTQTELQKFAEVFAQRYNSREVPLTTVLDLDHGIGYPIGENKSKYPYLADVELDFAKLAISDNFNVDNIDLFFLGKLKGPYLNCLELFDSDLDQLDNVQGDLGATSYGIAQIITKNNLNFFYINAIGGGSASNLLGRFSYGSKDVIDFVNEINQIETMHFKDCSVAEISHIPEERAGNVLFRPKIREYQLNYLSGVGRPATNCINISDLLIGLDNKIIYLKSVKSGKKIIPYLTNAHNYHNSTLPIYRFLCDFQYNGITANVNFSWGNIEKLYHRLPRLTYKEIILAKQQWIFEVNTLQGIMSKELGGKDLLIAVSKWQNVEQLPRYLQLVVGDNHLLVDFHSVFSVRMFMQSIRNQRICKLVEFLFTEESVIKDSENRNYINEIVFAIARKEVSKYG